MKTNPLALCVSITLVLVAPVALQGRPGYDFGDDGRAANRRYCNCVPYYQCSDRNIVPDKAELDRVYPDDERLSVSRPRSCGQYQVCCVEPESSTVKPYVHRCGVRNPSGINSRLLFATKQNQTEFGEWPWQAVILKPEGRLNVFKCAGVLIDQYHVLTVAHCVANHAPWIDDPLYPLTVRLGEWDTLQISEFLAHEDYGVSKILVHPHYSNQTYANDVAVLRLKEPVLFAPHIDTACLPREEDHFVGQNCVATGWGKDSYHGGTYSEVLREVVVRVLDNGKCEGMLRKTRLGKFYELHDGFLCAGGEEGIDTCKGDGGGPLVCYRKDKSYALAGLVSWGIDCGQRDVPGVYVNIQKYLPWISETTGIALREYWPKQ